MLSPNDGSRIVLLPEDKQLIELAGWTEAEYRNFVRYCKSESRIRPGEPVAIGLDIILLQIGIALVLSAASYFLTPKPKTGSRNTASPQINNVQVQGQDLVSGARFAPKAGFNSLQNVVELGSIVPLIYTKREEVDGVIYGGIRINTNLLWSQVLSLGGDQLLRSIYLVGEGDSTAGAMQLDPEQFALGNNLLGSYALEKNSTSRVSIYYSNDGGRIVNSDHIAGREPATGKANDPGNKSPQPITPDGDVFRVAGANNVLGANFSYAYKPGNQTAIGNFSWIGNGVCHKVNPSIAPAVRLQTVQKGPNSANFRVICPEDIQQLAVRDKAGYSFPAQSGVISGNTTLSIDDEVKYLLSSSLSRTGPFVEPSSDGVGGNAELTADDANQTVASWQQGFDEAIAVGELYRIGSALAICTKRTPEPFVSVAQDGNQSVEATFRVVRAGQMSNPPGTGGTTNMTQTSQIFRTSIGNFITEYPCQVLEIGLRSTLGIQISGLGYMNDPEFRYNLVDNAACIVYTGGSNDYPPNTTLNPRIVTNGSISIPETRYSCFRIGYRLAGTDDPFTMLSNIYGARSETSQPVYNYLRFEMDTSSRWEFTFEPISGWEIRYNIGGGKLYICDPKFSDLDAADGGEISVTEGLVTVRLTGKEITGAPFTINALQATEATLRYDGTSLSDSYARVAEAFPHSQITTTVGGNPEHEIVYINTIQPTTPAADYADLATVGVNIRASREFANLSQFSVYMNRGLGGFHDFPSVLRDLLTNDRYGVGEIVSPEQIENQSFLDATAWTESRRYYFDGALTEPLNIRTWGVERARDFLLDFIISNGKFALRPLLDFSGPEEITGIFTSGNILEDTFELTYFDQEQRQAPRVSVRWRQEQASGTTNNRGLFPVVREVTVREATTPLDAPFEQIDMSDFCTSQAHAIDRAKLECRFRTLSTHSVRFTTTTDQAALGLGKCFKLGMETLTFDQPQNGYVSRDGTITSWPPLADGTYTVQAWNGTGTAVTEQQLTVVSGKSATLQGHVFCVASAVARTQTYKVKSLSFNEEGNIEVEAIHWPTDSEGYSELVSGWDSRNLWNIEGAI